MTHFPSLTVEQRARLQQRGICAESSCDAFLAAIRGGDFPLTFDGLPRPPEGRLYHSRQPRYLTPVPLAVVLPHEAA